jgi:hypothetical protein
LKQGEELLGEPLGLGVGVATQMICANAAR